MWYVLKISHRALRFAEHHVRLNDLQHVWGDFVHVLQGPDAERHDRSVVLRREREDREAQSGLKIAEHTEELQWTALWDSDFEYHVSQCTAAFSDKFRFIRFGVLPGMGLREMYSLERTAGCRRLWRTCLEGGRCCPYWGPNAKQQCDKCAQLV